MRQRLAVFVLTTLTTIAVGCTSSVAGKAVPADESGAPSRNPVAVSALEGDLGRRRSPIEEIRGNIDAAGLEPVERDGSWGER